MLRKFVVGMAAVAAAGGICLSGTAGAAGGNGASICSGSSAPDGVVDLNNRLTWNSPGEVISYIAPNQVKPGQLVKEICNPNVVPI